MFAEPKQLASMVAAVLGVIVALEGDLVCDLKRESCQLVTDRRTHSEKHFQLVGRKSGEPYFAPSFNSTYVQVQGELKGDALTVFTLRHAMARQPFEGGAK